MTADFSRRTLLGATLIGTAGAAIGARADATTEGLVRADIRWDRFLADADPLWRRMPRAWYEGPFLGNALLGSTVCAQPGANAVRFTVSHSQVQDHRPQFGSLFGLARLPIGHLTLEPVGAITGVDWRLDLWNAELRGTITTAAGSLALRALVHDNRSVLVVEVTPTEGEAAFRWAFHPEEAVSPRADPVFGKPPPEGYVANPPPVVRRGDGMEVVVQPLLAGGQHVTAWREVTRGRTRTLYATVAWSFPDTTAEDRAVRVLRRTAVLPAAALVVAHRAWWHGYYRKSFLSLPDARMRSFYWIQLYKIASAARREAPVMATCGPWLEPTPWPAVWWNLNVQLEYWLIHGSNHLELDAVTRSLHEYRANLVDQVDERYRADSAGIPRTTDMTLLNGTSGGTSGFPVGVPGQATPVPEVGNLTWALHNAWLSYRHTMDTGVLRDVVVPLLRRSVNYYLHFLEPGPDGRLHLPATSSPEYGTNARDCNYDLALLRWGCRTLLESAAVLGVDDPLAPRWRDVLATLVDYPVDANGYMIGAGVPFAKSHRHYSHLLMVYPLYEVTGPDDRELVERSLRHWISFEGALQGYSFTGAASISALLSHGEDARFYLDELLRRFVQPNTMYKESGPVIETPLSAAQSVHDMVCQSWGGVIRVFPALPADWRDLAVHDFRTQGAFLLSAVRRAGRTEFVRLRSLAGAPCVLRTDIPGPLTVRSSWGRQVPWRVLPGGDVRIDVRRGEEVVVHARGTRPDLTVEPVSPDTSAPAWGLPA